MNDICFILNEDSSAWPEYITSHFQNSSKIKVGIEYDTKLFGNRAKTSNQLAKVTVVIVSHGHLEFLRENVNYNYKLLVPETSNAILFMLGAKTGDLDTRGLDGQPCKNRFPNFSTWKDFYHERTSEMTQYIERRLKSLQKKTQPPQRKGFKLVPDTARSEDPTVMSIFFTEPVSQTANQVKVEALLSDDTSGGLTIVVPAEWKNPYSFTFVAPEHREGLTNVRVLVDGKLAGSEPLNYVSNVEKYHALSQIYIHQLTKLCSLLKKNKVPDSEVDNCLSSIFDPESSTDIPVEAFEMLFGIYRHASIDCSDAELPSMLHFAAKHGFQELTSKLTDLPDAAVAHSIPNVDRKLPEQLARSNKHSSLTTFLENFREVNDTIEDLYVKCHGYINVGGPANDDLNGYLRAKNRVLDMKAAAEYIELLPSDVGEAAEEGEDELYYMYTPTPSKSSAAAAPTPAKKPSLKDQTPPQAVAKGHALSSNQQQLVDIMEMYKNKKCSMAEVEKLFKQWRRQYQDSSTIKSFKDKQEKMKKMKEDVAKACGEGGISNPIYQTKVSKHDGTPSLPPRWK